MDKWTCWTPWHLDLVQYDKPYCNYVKRAYFDRGKKKKRSLLGLNTILNKTKKKEI